MTHRWSCFRNCRTRRSTRTAQPPYVPLPMPGNLIVQGCKLTDMLRRYARTGPAIQMWAWQRCWSGSFGTSCREVGPKMSSMSVRVCAEPECQHDDPLVCDGTQTFRWLSGNDRCER